MRTANAEGKMAAVKTIYNKCQLSLVCIVKQQNCLLVFGKII